LNFSGNDKVDLRDAIMALQALTGQRDGLPEDIGMKDVVYILNILLSDAYESDDTPEQARPVSINTTYPNHNFHYAGDEDWLKFSGEPGRTYTIEAKNPGARSDVSIELYEADGTTKIMSANCSADNGNKSLTWDKCWQKGDYYIKVQ